LLSFKTADALKAHLTFNALQFKLEPISYVFIDSGLNSSLIMIPIKTEVVKPKLMQKALRFGLWKILPQATVKTIQWIVL